MSDTRLTLIGIGLVFAGFIILGVFGPGLVEAGVEAQQFDDCYEYFDDRPPVPVPCGDIQLARVLFLALVIGMIAAGVAVLVMGARGGWDQKTRPEDMVGPGPPGSG